MNISKSTQLDSPSFGAKNGLLYLLVGGGIGAAVALLFAPKSGSEFRGDIADVAHRGYEGAVDLAGTVKAKSVDLVQTAKEKREQVYDFAAQKRSRSADVGEVGQDLSGDILQMEQPSDEQGMGGSGRRSSSIV